jgi:hypothetical protein
VEDVDDPVPDVVVLVCPLTVVDDVTFPPPAVTDEDNPLVAFASLSSLWMMVHVLPSSSVTRSVVAATAIPPNKMSGKASGWLDSLLKSFMISS